MKKSKNIFVNLKRFQRSFARRLASRRMKMIYHILEYQHEIFTIIGYDERYRLQLPEIPDWKPGIAKLRLEYRKRSLAFFFAYWRFALLWGCMKQLQRDYDNYCQIME